jgi:hypothetical protein
VFLIPQPLTPVEVADLANRLEASGNTLEPSEIEALTAAQRAELTAWLAAIETGNDPDVVPAWLVTMIESRSETPDTPDTDQTDRAEGDNAPTKPMKAKKRANGSGTAAEA